MLSILHPNERTPDEVAVHLLHAYVVAVLARYRMRIHIYVIYVNSALRSRSALPRTHSEIRYLDVAVRSLCRRLIILLIS